MSTIRNIRKWRTSPQQFELMLEFMEANRDLTRPFIPANGCKERIWYFKKWQELSALLNCGRNPRSEAKWRKVWSDLKINTKRKVAKIKSFRMGGYPLQIHLTDVEKRVLAIIGEPLPETNDVDEAVFVQEHNEIERKEVKIAPAPSKIVEITVMPEDWNRPGTSRKAAPSPPPPRTPWQPPAKTAKQSSPSSSSNNGIPPDYSRSERESKWLYELEKEKLRQRDFELQLQAQWLDVMKEGLSILREFLPGRKKES